MVNSGGLLLNTMLLTVAVQVVHLPRTASAVVIMAIVAVVSFFGHRYISFRRPSGLQRVDRVPVVDDQSRP